MRIVAYAADRQRLLEHGEMATTTYSNCEPDEAARNTYRSMVEAADLMGLMLSEPILEVGPADWTGGRYITTRAGVFDQP